MPVALAAEDDFVSLMVSAPSDSRERSAFTHGLMPVVLSGALIGTSVEMTLTRVVFSPAALHRRRQAVLGGHQRFLRGGRDPAGLPGPRDVTQQSSGSAGDELCSTIDSFILAVRECFRTSVEATLGDRECSWAAASRNAPRISTFQRSSTSAANAESLMKVALAHESHSLDLEPESGCHHRAYPGAAPRVLGQGAEWASTAARAAERDREGVSGDDHGACAAHRTIGTAKRRVPSCATRLQDGRFQCPTAPHHNPTDPPVAKWRH